MMDPDREQEADAAAAAGDFATARQLLLSITQAQPERFEPWFKLAAMCQAMRDFSAALSAMDNALALRPRDFAGLFMRARLLDATGAREAADQAYGHALICAPCDPPPQFAAVMDQARHRYRAWQEREASRMRDAAGAHLEERLEAMIRASVQLAEPAQDGPTHYCYPGLTRRAFHPRDAFPWLADLEAATDDIQSECEALLGMAGARREPYLHYSESLPLDQWRELNHNLDWTAIHLVQAGGIVPENAGHCPRTMAALRSIPQPAIPGAGANAMFSLLAPHTHIPPHTGIANIRLLCHLPLIVPAGCWFRVGDTQRLWERGRAWIFDDTIEHEAMNPSDHLRVILIVDCWHPDLSLREREGIAAVIGAGGKVHGL